MDSRPDQIKEHKDAIIKMIMLDLDPMLPVIRTLYPSNGRPAELQVEIFRSFILMVHMGIPLDKWVYKLSVNPVLRIIAGFNSDKMPGTSSYYDFINRIVPMDDRPVIKHFLPKPKIKLKKGEKLPPKNVNIVASLVNRIINDEMRFRRLLSRRPERFLQKIFARVAVDASVNIGLVPKNVSVSGDGTCIETGASIYAKTVCSCRKNGIYKCNCDRKFSDPNATWGWDSHNEKCFYGYSGFFISTHNKESKIDLPLYIRLLQANRHDSVSAVFALSEFKEMHPELHIDTFIADSACDNYATYELLQHWDINAVIALNDKNKGNFKYPPPVCITDDGVPICPNDYEMVYNGYCKIRHRIKWRCPRSRLRIHLTEPCEGCSQSHYGRVVYTKPDWDLRFFTRIPRGTNAWKTKMKERTAAERVNDRILLDYGIERSPTRGKKRISFFITLAAINIHLDAQVKVQKINGLHFFDNF